MDGRVDTRNAAIVFDDVSVTYGEAPVLDRVTALVPPKSCTAIVGPNGAGKTTLLMALLGRISFSGRIVIAGNGHGSSPRIGYVPQRFAFDRGLPITVMECMVMGSQRLPLWLGQRRQRQEEARSLLEAVNLGGIERRRLGALSGGEMQRVLLALALQQRPDLLVLDEPAAGVDPRGGRLFCELLDALRAERGFTQVMVSHDLATVTHHATHVICLNRSVAAEGVPQDVLTQETLRRVFGPHIAMGESGVIRSCCSDGPAHCEAGERHA